jgi:hypothetical protein
MVLIKSLEEKDGGDSALVANFFNVEQATLGAHV